MTNTIARALAATAIAGTLTGAAFAGTAAAHADTTDSTFVQILHEQNIGHLSGDGALIEIGHGICRNLRRGYSINHEIYDVYRVSSLSMSQTGYLVGASIGSYCTEFSY